MWGWVGDRRWSWFLIVPATTQRINREANEKVVGYSNAQASQAAELAKKEEEIAQSQETVDSANEQIAQAEEKVAAYENLIKASEVYNAGNFDQTGTHWRRSNAYFGWSPGNCMIRFRTGVRDSL